MLTFAKYISLAEGKLFHHRVPIIEHWIYFGATIVSNRPQTKFEQSLSQFKCTDSAPINIISTHLRKTSNVP